jgi:threonine dehydrogenase-like Zn-dependent dehydrogenase
MSGGPRCTGKGRRRRHPRQPALVNLFQVFWKELEIIGARVYERDDFDEAMLLISGGAIPVDRLITDVVPLADAVSAIERLSAGGDVIKILVDCR